MFLPPNSYEPGKYKLAKVSLGHHGLTSALTLSALCEGHMVSLTLCGLQLRISASHFLDGPLHLYSKTSSQNLKVHSHINYHLRTLMASQCFSMGRKGRFTMEGFDLFPLPMPGIIMLPNNL